MARTYATTSDIRAFGYSISEGEEEVVQKLLEAASAKLRLHARKRGKDLDALISDEESGEDYSLAVQSVVVQAVCRALSSARDSSPAVTQASQGGLGYTASITYLNAGQSLYFLRNELKELGLMQQTWGALEVFKDAAD